MKIIVFSDSHGRSRGIEEGLERNSPGLDLCVFLGDGVRDVEFALNSYPDLPRVIVSGNGEEFSSLLLSGNAYPREVLFEEGGIKFLALHGHRPCDVKGGLGGVAKYAAEMGADVVLYGHTHQKNDTYITMGEKRIRLINPGSAGRGMERSFALLNIEKGMIVCGFGEI